MGDFDRDRDPHAGHDHGTDREHIRETDRTTTVVTDGGERRAGGGWIIGVLVLIALLALLWFLFGNNLNRAADETGVNVNVEAPEVKIPEDVKLEVPDKVNVDLPDDINVDTDGNSQ